MHARQVKLEKRIDFTAIARATSGASGAELANIINEAALRAVREGRNAVSQSDLEESVETVIAGYQRKNAVLSEHEKRVVSYHEVGHALVAALQSNTAPVTKITIVPRTSGALGYTMQVDQDDKKLLTREELLSKIAVLTGGRAAEEVVFGQVTTGASNDIEQATKLARAMITRYGMSDEFGMVAMETVSNQYLGGDTSLACSPDTATAIDRQVVDVVRAQHDKAVELLKKNMASLNRVAEYLYREETITGEQFMALLRGQERAPPRADGAAPYRRKDIWDGKPALRVCGAPVLLYHFSIRVRHHFKQLVLGHAAHGKAPAARFVGGDGEIAFAPRLWSGTRLRRPCPRRWMTKGSPSGMTPSVSAPPSHKRGGDVPRGHEGAIPGVFVKGEMPEAVVGEFKDAVLQGEHAGAEVGAQHVLRAAEGNEAVLDRLHVAVAIVQVVPAIAAAAGIGEGERRERAAIPVQAVGGVIRGRPSRRRRGSPRSRRRRCPWHRPRDRTALRCSSRRSRRRPPRRSRRVHRHRCRCRRRGT